MDLRTSRRSGIRREYEFPGDAVDFFLGQSLLPASIATGCAQSEDTKENNESEE
jgi:hypothetical protein